MLDSLFITVTYTYSIARVTTLHEDLGAASQPASCVVNPANRLFVTSALIPHLTELGRKEAARPTLFVRDSAGSASCSPTTNPQALAV